MNYMNWKMEIYEAYKAGTKQSELARKYGISPSKVSQVVRDMVYKLEERPARRLMYRDQSIAMFGTAMQKVSLLLPHLEAIKAIAEEKNT